MLTVEVMGGLGNQLFQIFTMIGYSLRHNIPYYIERGIPSRHDRPFYWDSLLITLSSKLRDKRPIRVLSESTFHYKEIPYMTQHFKLYGYFQSYKYFNDQQQDIIQLLDIQNHKLKMSQPNDNNNVSLHFRIGDYANIQHHHPIMVTEYYIRCLKCLVDDTGRDNWNILYFYEENNKDIVTQKIETIKQSFPNLTFEAISSHYKDYEQMLIMSNCQHNIIANSTFSWWGAYFNTNPEHKTYYPSKWFGPAQGNKKIDDLFPPDWVKIDA